MSCKSLVIAALASAALLGCELFAEKEAEHPGCPGQSFRSATSESDCTCGGDSVLRAGSLECETCNPVPSSGASCLCPEGGTFSFDSSLEAALNLNSAQVTCSARAACADGEKPTGGGDSCAPCEALDCGGGCGACPVGRSCVSGRCALASECVVLKAEKFSATSSGVSQDLAPSCDYGDGNVALVSPELPPGAQCDFMDGAGCSIDAVVVPLTPADVLHRGCPGESNSGNGACKCPGDTVLRAGALECKDCEPAASGGAYCDCGENAVMSFSGVLEFDLSLTSEQVHCEAPAECESGMRPDTLSGACIPCGPTECGTGCGLCAVGQTCISGVCVAAAACRITSTEQLSYTSCSFSAGKLAYFGPSSVLPPGSDCSYTDLDNCYYEATAEVLSK